MTVTDLQVEFAEPKIREDSKIEINRILARIGFEFDAMLDFRNLFIRGIGILLKLRSEI